MAKTPPNLSDACSIMNLVIPKLIGLGNSDRLDRVVRATYVLRTNDEQTALYEQGRTAPGKIVTYKDGVISKSMHQKQLLHGEDCAHAVDISVIQNGQYVPDPAPYKSLVALVEAMALPVRCGAAWLDFGHYECIPEKV
jgi:hypothetical protein